MQAGHPGLPRGQHHGLHLRLERRAGILCHHSQVQARPDRLRRPAGRTVSEVIIFSDRSVAVQDDATTNLAFAVNIQLKYSKLS